VIFNRSVLVMLITVQFTETVPRCVGDLMTMDKAVRIQGLFFKLVLVGVITVAF